MREKICAMVIQVGLLAAFFAGVNEKRKYLYYVAKKIALLRGKCQKKVEKTHFDTSRK